MSQPLVVILRPIPEPGPSLLAKKYKVRLNESNKILGEKERQNFVRGAHAILSILTDRIDEPTMTAAGGSLKIIANYAVGFDNVDLAAAKKREIVVTNTPGVLSDAVAEHTISLMLAAARRIPEADQFVRLGRYRQWEPLGFLGPELRGKTLGIIGLGRIGSRVAEIAQTGFGMTIVYHDLERNQAFERHLGSSFHTLPVLLKLADVVSLHVPLLPSTHHLIGASEFLLMKKTAILVNTSRGPVVDERALVRALKTKQIFAAGLDVYEFEPKLAPGLTKLPNVVLTPHIASATQEARAEMSRLAALNIINVLSGKKPLSPVNLHT